ncbi:MAG TPA: hypothetical protein ACFYEA_08275 [Candidatus Tripitaka californicus]|uniref:hypothetical protein n=1 Tax=Candidatus Tripitaka californicus TaxID=3367616 RepID=UPI004025EF51|nr:PQQ-binding-like beta-propeller repeat protein [Planctomycetota bacterium]
MINCLGKFIPIFIFIFALALPVYGHEEGKKLPGGHHFYARLKAGDWPLFNKDRFNSSFSPVKGKMKFDRPKVKWQKEHPFIDTGFTSLSARKFLDFIPAEEGRVVFLKPSNGKERFSLKAPDVVTPTEQGTRQNVPLFEDVTGNRVPELIASIDSYGIVVWNTINGQILWSKVMPHQGPTSTLNVVVGDVNDDGEKELIVMNDNVALRELHCLDARTGQELWVYTDRDIPCTTEWDCNPGGEDFSWMQGATSQNFPVWSGGRLFFQNQVSSVQGNRSVDIISIETTPSTKSMTIYNNPPNPFSNSPVPSISRISDVNALVVGEYLLDFPDATHVTVNGGPLLEITPNGSTPHFDIVPGGVLFFSPSTTAGDKAVIGIHNAPRRVWKKTFTTGFCFAHFLLSDFNNDGREEISFGTTERYYQIDLDGNVLWQYDTGIPAQNVPYLSAVFGGAFADIDGDGIKEILFNAFDTLVCLKGHNGTPKWTFQVPFGDLVEFGAKQPTNFIRAFPLIADLNGDGGLEAVMADAEHVYAIDKDGHVAMKYRFATFTPGIGSTTIDGKPMARPFTSKRFIFADIDRDKRGELVGAITLQGTPNNVSRVFVLE